MVQTNIYRIFMIFLYTYVQGLDLDLGFLGVILVFNSGHLSPHRLVSTHDGPFSGMTFSIAKLSHDCQPAEAQNLV